MDIIQVRCSRNEILGDVLGKLSEVDSMAYLQVIWLLYPFILRHDQLHILH
jgi:hypothetical protein